jgi:hypothetical protein
MYKLRSLILLPIFLFACGSLGGESPAATAVPDANNDAETTGSPRLSTDAPPTATTLPPTWTPLPDEGGATLPPAVDTADDSAGGTSTNGGVVQETAVPAYDGPTVNYIVQRGDTLAEICIKYSVPITQVAQINNINDWDHIEVGQVLILPSD